MSEESLKLRWWLVRDGEIKPRYPQQSPKEGEIEKEEKKGEESPEDFSQQGVRRKYAQKSGE